MTFTTIVLRLWFA